MLTDFQKKIHWQIH